MAQRIVIPGFRKIETSGGGQGGTTNYADLTNKPSINNVPLVGNLKTVDLKLTDATLTEEGVPAEAKTVGELINKLSLDMNNFLTEDISVTQNVKSGTVHAYKNGNCVTITAWSQATPRLRNITVIRNDCKFTKAIYSKLFTFNVLLY